MILRRSGQRGLVAIVSGAYKAAYDWDSDLHNSNYNPGALVYETPGQGV